MSCSALRQASGIRGLCQSCRDRKARFRYRGIVRADRDHTLCFECYRSERDRQRSRLLTEPPVAFPRDEPAYDGFEIFLSV